MCVCLCVCVTLRSRAVPSSPTPWTVPSLTPLPRHSFSPPSFRVDKGRVYSWGYNHDGQLGTGSAAECVDVPTLITAFSGSGSGAAAVRVLQVACGGSHALFLTSYVLLLVLVCGLLFVVIVYCVVRWC